ncbi:DUF397 domain-containing protein [Streptomyces sp. 6N223]|uniref:DUF397 domain-containing protein n=1 Tax=Streptomyces sp. 6N223 TaxID=3457412 RepID=UPI003FCF20CD
MSRVDLLHNAQWFTSSHSNGNGNCVEVAFVRSSYSNGNGACVEVADLGSGTVATRDSKCQDGPVLTTPAAGWQAFIAGVASGRFGER